MAPADCSRPETGRKCHTTSSLPSLFLALLTCSRLLTTVSSFMGMIKHISTFHGDNHTGVLQLLGSSHHKQSTLRNC